MAPHSQPQGREPTENRIAPPLLCSSPLAANCSLSNHPAPNPGRHLGSRFRPPPHLAGSGSTPAGSPSPHLAGIGSRPWGPKSLPGHAGQPNDALVLGQVKVEPEPEEDQDMDVEVGTGRMLAEPVGLDADATTGDRDSAEDFGGAHWWRGVVLQQSGPVVRHASLQTAGDPDTEDSRVRRRREDRLCTAGLRGPAGAIRRLPGTVALTRDLFCCLRRARAKNADLQGLHRAGGSQPSRAPPQARSLAAVRREFGRCLDVMPADVESHHPATPWRHALFKALATPRADLRDSDLSVAIRAGGDRVGLRGA